MWALTAAPIQNNEARQLLARYQKQNGFQSNMWLLPRHLTLFGVRALYPAQLLLPTRCLLSNPPRAVPFALLAPPTQRRILHDCPVPMVPPGRYLFLERTPAVTRWRAATVAECFDAAFIQSNTSYGHMQLLCESNCAERLLMPEEVAVLNAQETSNPFLIDTGLCHRNLVTGATLQDAIGSVLTTIAAQFCYSSFDWVEASVVESAGLRVRPLATPHRVNCTEKLGVVHVSQLPMLRQEELVESIPRYVLLKSQKTSFVYLHAQWRNQSKLGLTSPLRRSDIPPADCDGDPPVDLLLWVAVTPKDEFSGPITKRERSVYRRFYNAQQLD